MILDIKYTRMCPLVNDLFLIFSSSGRGIGMVRIESDYHYPKGGGGRRRHHQDYPEIGHPAEDHYPEIGHPAEDVDDNERRRRRRISSEAGSSSGGAREEYPSVGDARRMRREEPQHVRQAPAHGSQVTTRCSCLFWQVLGTGCQYGILMRFTHMR